MSLSSSTCGLTSFSRSQVAGVRPSRVLALRRRPAQSSSRRSLLVKAEFGSAAKPPKEVSQPPRQPEVPPARFGFNEYAERINSRACMIGFFALILVEALTGQGFLQTIGIQVGRGLDIGF